MGDLTIHVLDIAGGRAAARIKVELWAFRSRRWKLLKRTATNADGRTDKPLLEKREFRAGTYQLVFHVGAYFRSRKFLDTVPVRFRIADSSAHYHVPLLCSPWSYTTYRGR